MKMKAYLVLLMVVLARQGVLAQDSSKTALFIPVVFYLPETRWGVGGVGAYNFQINPADTLSPASQIRGGGSYTQEKQFLSYASCNLYWNERTWQVAAELGWYRYAYYFFGVGNDAPEDLREYYPIEFPRVRMDIIRKIRPKLFGGVRFWYDDFTIDQSRLEPEGVLIDGQISGSKGGKTGGPGIILQYDSRDNVYSTYRGIWLEGVWQTNKEGAFSDYTFDKYRLEFKAFQQFREKWVVGFNTMFLHTTGNVPFMQMAMLGGSQRSRGYYEGRFRDRNVWVGQVEVRRPLFWRLSGAAFLSTGAVANEISLLSIDKAHYAGGMGIRVAIDPVKRINLRLDLAITDQGNTNWYLTFGEAF